MQSVSNLRFISRENFMLSWAEHEKSFITSGPVLLARKLNLYSDAVPNGNYMFGQSGNWNWQLIL